MNKNYWQVAAGSSGRDYAERFLEFGMAFVGGETQIATMKEVSVGDIVLLKRGLSEVVAVGEVVKTGQENKTWLQDFDGWVLSGYCYVNWHVPDNPIQTNGLTRATIQRVHNAEHKRLADDTLGFPVRQPEPEPTPTEPINDGDILDFLVSEGLRPSAAEDLTNTFRRIRLLTDYYYKQYHGHWEDIREHETRSFLVIPLLLALGWAEQQIKIELPCKSGRIDVACFSRAYHRRGDAECSLIIETKDFSTGLDFAPEQARRYAAEFPSCKTLVVTNGYCYKTYVRSKATGFSKTPSAYLNLLKPHKRYPLDPQNVDGALEVLRCLLPSNVR